MGKDHQRSTAIDPPALPRAAKADFDDLVVVCSKCAKRQGLAKREFGRSLKRAFKRETGGRKMRVVEAGCLGPCPKRQIAVATPESIGRSRVLLLEPTLPVASVRGLFPEHDSAAFKSADTPR
ncbi:MAG: (2Fe-2S) ferredoxin domain-containing protein [Microvirga sp.]